MQGVVKILPVLTPHLQMQVVIKIPIWKEVVSRWIPYQMITPQGRTFLQVLETPSEFPFEIEDKPWEQTIALTRDFGGDDIKVIVHMPADHSSTIEETGDEPGDQNHDQDKDSASGPQSSIRLVVTQTNFLETTLEYGVIAYPDNFSIDSFCVKYAKTPERNICYKGPDYAKLDKNLRKEFHRRLKIRGIIPSTTNFLHEYMANRDVCSSDSSNSSPTTTDQSTPEAIKTTFAEDISNSGKNPEDFIWIPYPYTRSEKPLWIEVPSKGFYASESELEDGSEYSRGDYSDLFLDGEAFSANPYRDLPPKLFGDPPVISEEMDKILYPDLY
ncbi:hypothetical protein MKW98_012840 [Papaver atlanticum]|uniref:Uncharacterized protein n=1 Tax=Papaver atlanticum TaxID=357466 RepID=A0AAD4XI68_9MAGN|nr:hypothetical protein MKW98_012840 [Papaver atlanticum]